MFCAVVVIYCYASAVYYTVIRVFRTNGESRHYPPISRIFRAMRIVAMSTTATPTSQLMAFDGRKHQVRQQSDLLPLNWTLEHSEAYELIVCTCSCSCSACLRHRTREIQFSFESHSTTRKKNTRNCICFVAFRVFIFISMWVVSC